MPEPFRKPQSKLMKKEERNDLLSGPKPQY